MILCTQDSNEEIHNINFNSCENLKHNITESY